MYSLLWRLDWLLLREVPRRPYWETSEILLASSALQQLKLSLNIMETIHFLDQEIQFWVFPSASAQVLHFLEG